MKLNLSFSKFAVQSSLAPKQPNSHKKFRREFLNPKIVPDNHYAPAAPFPAILFENFELPNHYELLRKVAEMFPVRFRAVGFSPPFESPHANNQIAPSRWLRLLQN